jgi:hypothetical protein
MWVSRRNNPDYNYQQPQLPRRRPQRRAVPPDPAVPHGDRPGRPDLLERKSLKKKPQTPPPDWWTDPRNPFGFTNPFSPNNPLGYTHPFSPNNPHGINNPLSPNYWMKRLR